MEVQRRQYISLDQKSVLVNFLKDHPQLARATFSKGFTVKMAQELWKNLTDKLNSIPGPKKEWRRWRKTWQDMRSVGKLKKGKMKMPTLATDSDHNKEIRANLGQTQGPPQNAKITILDTEEQKPTQYLSAKLALLERIAAAKERKNEILTEQVNVLHEIRNAITEVLF